MCILIVFGWIVSIYSKVGHIVIQIHWSCDESVTSIKGGGGWWCIDGLVPATLWFPNVTNGDGVKGLCHAVSVLWDFLFYIDFVDNHTFWYTLHLINLHNKNKICWVDITTF